MSYTVIIDGVEHGPFHVHGMEKAAEVAVRDLEFANGVFPIGIGGGIQRVTVKSSDGRFQRDYLVTGSPAPEYEAEEDRG